MAAIPMMKLGWGILSNDIGNIFMDVCVHVCK